MAELPLDDNYKPVIGLWDAAGHQVVAAQAGTVLADSTTGAKYAAFQSGTTASATGTLTSIAGTITASTQLLASNTSRKGMMVYNESSAILYLGFSATVTATSYSVQIPANGFFEMPTAPVYTGVIAGVWSAANGSARLTELI